jgi:hypothetical protein
MVFLMEAEDLAEAQVWVQQGSLVGALLSQPSNSGRWSRFPATSCPREKYSLPASEESATVEMQSKSFHGFAVGEICWGG